MKLYAGTTEQFMADTQMHRIAEKLRTEYVAQIGYKPGPAEFNAWQNSLQALALLINQAKLEDHGVILEYQLGNTSKRLDAMLTGRSSTSAENAVVVELKQWGTTAPLTGGRLRRDVRRPEDPAGAPPIGPGRRLPAMAARQPRRLLRHRCRRADRGQLPPQHAVRPEPASSGPTPRRVARGQSPLHRRPVSRAGRASSTCT